MDNCLQYPIYNTQGQLTSKNMHQVFSDSFMRYLACQSPKLESQGDYTNQYFPTCCSDISSQGLAAKVVDIKYHNNNACLAERNPLQNKHRVG